MIDGKLAETSHDTTSVQVVIAENEEGEQLLLRDMRGTILVTPTLPFEASRSSTPSQGDFDYKEGAESFAAEMRRLESVLQMLEEESMILRTELDSTREEVRHLRAELSKENCRLVELWQDNSKQLLDHDLAMTEKEKEVQLLREQLQMREMELARLKLSHLREPAICSHASIPEISSQAVVADDHSGELSTQIIKSSAVQSTTRPTRGSIFPSLRILRDDIPSSFREEESQEMPSSRSDVCNPITKVEQRGHVGTSTTTNLEHVVTFTTTNLEHVVTSSLTTTTNLSTHDVTSSKTNPFQRGSETQMVNSGGQAQSLGISDQGSTQQNQSNQQVTNLSTSLTDALYVSRPICSVGTTDHGKLTGDSYAHNPQPGKAPPTDPFTAEDRGMTFDDWLPILERVAIWNEWTPEESLMQLAGHLWGRALREWRLLLPDERANYQAATQGLRERLDPGNQL